MKEIDHASPNQKKSTALLHITSSSRLLKVLKQDKRAIFSAASHAQKAAEYLHGLQPEPQPEFTPDDPRDGPA